MKKVISKILIMTIIFNIIVSFSALASGETTLYNCGHVVDLEHDLQTYNGNLYICRDDVWQLDLDYENNYIRKESTQLYFQYGSSVVEIGGRTMLYPQSCIKVDDAIYISLDLIAMAFSKLYETDGNNIYLWIEYREYSTRFVRGMVTLAYYGETAPKGGIEVEVFAGIKATATPSYSTRTVYLENYPDYTELSANMQESYDYNKIATTIVTIPEGEQGAEFYLSTDKTFYNCEIVCRPINNDYYAKNSCSFNKYATNYNLTIYSEPGGYTAYGKIIVDKPCEEDTKFVVATGQNYIERKKLFTLPKGETEIAYSIRYDMYYNSRIYVVSNNGQYMKKLTGTIGNTYNGSVNYDIHLQSSRRISSCISLPNDEVAKEDMNISVSLKSLISDKTVSTASVIIPTGENSADIDLFDDTGLVYCYYELVGNYDGYYKYGYYGGSKSVVNRNDAEMIYNSSISIPLIKSQRITAEVCLPDGEVAENNITGSLSAIESKNDTDTLSVSSLFSVSDGDMSLSANASGVATSGGSSGGGGGGISVVGGIPVTVSEIHTIIEKGENRGTISLDILEDEPMPYLELNINDSGNRYYPKMYYSQNGGSVIKENATKPQSENISFTLIKQHKISGMIDELVSKSYKMLYAVAQEDINKRQYIYQSQFFAKTYIYGEDKYSLYVPDEIKNYILCLDSNYNYDEYSASESYYSENSAFETIENSEIITVNGDLDNIDLITPKYSSDLPIRIFAYKNGEEYQIVLERDYDNLPLECCAKVGFYDHDGKLTDLKKYDIFMPKYACNWNITISDMDISSAEKMKIFVWDKDLKPLSNSYEMQISESTTSINLSSINYGDVDDRMSYAEAIYALSALQVVNGYEDGYFRPAQLVTRAEAVALIVNALNMRADAQTVANTSSFIDVNENSWFSGIVNLGVTIGFIDVPSDGRFHPNEIITYAQFCEMLVKITGYGDYAAAYGGYPIGYTTMATSAGISKGVGVSYDTPLNRAQVCQMLYNAITTPVLAVIEYSLNGNEYAPLDGTGNKQYKTILSDKFDGYLIKGIVDSFPETGTVKLTNVISDYAKADGAYKYFDTTTSPYTINEANIENDIDLSNSIGQQINALLYVDTNNIKHLVFATQ